MICSKDQIQEAITGFEQLIENNQDLGKFIQNHTNWHKVAEGNGLRESMRFNNCYYTIAFKIFRPTGEVYPCFVRVSDADYLLGNFINANKDEHIKINLISFLMFNRKRNFCDPDKCRMSWLNNIAETGINTAFQQLSEETAKSYFF